MLRCTDAASITSERCPSAGPLRVPFIVSLLHSPTDFSPSSGLLSGVFVSQAAVWWTSLHAKLDSEDHRVISGFIQPAC